MSDFPALVLGGGVLDRQLADPERMLLAYREDEGRRYLEQTPITPRDRIVPEDLAVTLLLNSRVGWKAYKSIQDLGPSIDLSTLPSVALEATSTGQSDALASLIREVAGWPGFATSVATKVLHKKRPALIPVLDNQAIFGAYMSAKWPASRSRGDSVWAIATIRDALERIAYDLTRTENAAVWAGLRSVEPDRSLIELFGMVWWSHFRRIEPVGSGSVAVPPASAP
jgi:hypothetical protein